VQSTSNERSVDDSQAEMLVENETGSQTVSDSGSLPLPWVIQTI